MTGNASHLYWAGLYGSNGAIGRAALDGTGSTPSFINLGTGWLPQFVALTPSHAWWTESNGANTVHQISRAPIDSPGSAERAVITTTGAPRGIVITPDTPPRAPSNVTAAPVDHGAVVAWGVPPTDGGSAITGYTATANPGGATCQTGVALTCTLTGLVPGAAYTMTVVAANALGTGSPSVPSATVTPTGAVAQPASPTSPSPGGGTPPEPGEQVADGPGVPAISARGRFRIERTPGGAVIVHVRLRAVVPGTFEFTWASTRGTRIPQGARSRVGTRTLRRGATTTRIVARYAGQAMTLASRMPRSRVPRASAIVLRVRHSGVGRSPSRAVVNHTGTVRASG